MKSIHISNRRRAAVLLAVALVVSAGTAAAVSILTKDPNTISAAEGTLSSSAVTVDSQSLSYTGTEVTALDVVVNNTGGSSHTVTLHVAVRDSNGNVVESTSKSGVSVGSGNTKTVTVSLSNHKVDTFTTIEVTVEQTG